MSQAVETGDFLGVHVVADLWGTRSLGSAVELDGLLRRAAETGGATVIQVVTHQYSPSGLSGVALLAESHLSLHEWPENRFTAIDIFTCGRTTDPDVILAVLAERYEPERRLIKRIARGVSEMNNCALPSLQDNRLSL